MTSFPHDPNALFADITLRATYEGEDLYWGRLFEVLVSAACPEGCSPSTDTHTQCVAKAEEALKILSQ